MSVRSHKWLFLALAIGICGGLTLQHLPVSASVYADDGAAIQSGVEAEIFFEVNSTDGDVGIQAFFDAEGWEELKIIGPDDGILEVETDGGLGEIGLTELFFESEEPSFDDISLEDFKALFPAGVYTFEATTPDGGVLVGMAELTHDIPGPVTLDVTGPTIIAWTLPTEPLEGEPEIDHILVIIDGEGVTFTIELDASDTSLIVPSPLPFGTDYTIEVLTVDEKGNATIAEQKGVTLGFE